MADKILDLEKVRGHVQLACHHNHFGMSSKAEKQRIYTVCNQLHSHMVRPAVHLALKGLYYLRRTGAEEFVG